MLKFSSWHGTKNGFHFNFFVEKEHNWCLLSSWILNIKCEVILMKKIVSRGKLKCFSKAAFIGKNKQSIICLFSFCLNRSNLNVCYVLLYLLCNHLDDNRNTQFWIFIYFSILLSMHANNIDAISSGWISNWHLVKKLLLLPILHSNNL